MSEVRVVLKPGRERNVVRGHPWIFSGAVASVDGSGADQPASVAEVWSADGVWIGRGLFNPVSQLAVRLFVNEEALPLTADLIARRVMQAVRRREDALTRTGTGEDTDSYRLVFSESDGLSGLIADRYAGVVSLRFSAPWPDTWVDAVVDALRQACGDVGVHVAAEADAPAREGLAPDRFRAISTWPSERQVTIRESGLRYHVSPAAGQKTGFYLDQRDNRRAVARWAGGRRVLSAYCYTGAFELHAARAGASEILGLDASAAALAQAAGHAELNGVTVPLEYRRADVPVALRKFRDEGRTFDLIILDPPRFVFSRAQLDKGLRAYKDINLLALKLLAPGGVLATFSCSGLVGPETFSEVLGWAAVDAGRTVRVLARLGQPWDHPVRAGFPESEYLKGLIAEVE